MKKYYFVLLATLIFLTVFFYSCNKYITAAKGSNNKTPEEILTANSWQISKIKNLQGFDTYNYLRGSSNHELDNEFITFDSNHTGTYTAPNGAQSPISSWNFIDAEKTQLEYTIMFARPLTVNWENVALTPSSIKYGEYHAFNGVNSLSIATRIPKQLTTLQ